MFSRQAFEKRDEPLSIPLDEPEGQIGLGWKMMVHARLPNADLAGEIGVAEAVEPAASSEVLG